MSFLIGTSKANVQPQYTGIQIQTSSSTIPVSLVWGKARGAPNLIWYGDFKAIKHTQQAGKGGGQQSTSYTYSASVIMGLCEGPITGIGQAWVDTGTEASYASLGFSLFLGTVPQSPWGYMTSAHPSQALDYPGVAYVCQANYNLGSSATLPNHTFEVEGLLYNTSINGEGDADPAQVIYDFLTNQQYGVLFPSTRISSATLFSTSAATTTGDSSYQTYVRAMGWGISPYITNQEAANSILDRWAQLTNSALVWTGYTLKFIPYGDATVSANGVTYLPPTAVTYNLTDGDYLQSANTDPVIQQRVDAADAYNCVKIEVSDRSNAYNLATLDWHDQTLVDLYGRREQSSITAHEICDTNMGHQVVSLIGARVAYIRNTFTVQLGPQFSLIEPMDVLTLTDAAMGLNALPVRVTQIQEDDSDNFTVTFEEFPGTTGQPNTATSQTATPTVNNSLAAPDPVNTPIIFDVPADISQGVPSVFCAVSGGASGVADPNWGGCIVYVSTDNSTFTAIGQINAPARMGALTASLAAYGGANPDTTDTAAVSLVESAGTLVSATSPADAAAGSTLCYCGGEFLSYQTATLTGANAYNLTNLYRGLHGSTGAAHSSGAPFCRIDSALFTYQLPAAYIGHTLYFKFQSLNIWGRASQDLSTCTSYSYTPTGAGFTTQPPSTIFVTGAPAAPASLTATGGQNINTVQWPGSTSPGVAYYKVYAEHVGTGGSFGSATLIAEPTGNSFTHAGLGNSDAWTYWVTAVNTLGQESTTQAGPAVGTTSGAAGGTHTYFGSGAPSTIHNDGDLYFDTSVSPNIGYVQESGAWVKTQPYGFAFSRTVGTIPASSTVARFESGIPWTLPAGLANCRGEVDTAPTASTVFNITVAGTTVATMTFASGSTSATFALSSTQNVSAGQPVAVVAPSNLNGMSGLLDFSILGTR